MSDQRSDLRCFLPLRAFVDLEIGSAAEGHSFGIIDELSVDVRVAPVHGEPWFLSRAGNL